MNNLTEILGQYKSAASTNTDIKTRFILEQPSTFNVEANLFYDISQDAQFVSEKQNAKNFRFYGNISPIINKLAYNKTHDNNDPTKTVSIPINIDTTILDFNNDNWSVVLLKTIPDSTNKGVKQVTNQNVTYSFLNGLPALPYKPNIITDPNKNKGFVMYLGHNFNVGDTIYITTTTPTPYISNGIYTITDVNGDIIRIDQVYRLEIIVSADNQSVYSPINNFNTPKSNTAFGGDIQINKQDNVKSNSLKLKPDITNSSTLNMMNITINNIEHGYFDDSGVTNFVSSRPSYHKTVKPNIFVRKIQNNEILEYYVKKGVVISVLDGLDNCGFSLSPFGLRNMNYVFNEQIDLNNLTDHLNYPINNLYVGIIKKNGGGNSKFSDVESNFSRLIEFTNVNDGFEVLKEQAHIGQELLISLCEYSTETLQETDIMGINHRFIHNDVLFYYNPFTKIPIKLLSSYLNVAENMTQIPPYAVFSKSQENYIWKTFFDIGQADENGNVIDFPFMNNSFYVFNDIKLFVNIESNKTPKYVLGGNDLTQINNSNINNIINDIKSLTNTFDLGVSGSTNNTYKKYNNIQC